MMEVLKAAGTLPAEYWPLLQAATLSHQEAPLQLDPTPTQDIPADLLVLLPPATTMTMPPLPIVPLAPTKAPLLPETALPTSTPAPESAKAKNKYIPLMPYLKANPPLCCRNHL
eukprot:10185567-Ditylum_brightwellii.AAC.1